jgi:hypothetical protein
MRLLALATIALTLPCATASTAQAPAREAAMYRCESVTHALVDFHRASLELATDGTFELHHTHTSPSNGWSTWLRGRYTQTEREIVLTPVSALRRVWRGDMHRREHGEEVGAEQREETVSTAPWRLPALGGDCYAAREIGTRVCATHASEPVPPCDAGSPPHRPRH